MIANHIEDRATLQAAIAGMLPEDDRLSPGEFERALEQALAEQFEFERMVTVATDKALAWTAADPCRRIVALAGRPYHIDPSLNHHIDEELADLGFAVVPALGLAGHAPESKSLKGLWKPSKHLLKLIELASSNPQLEIVALRSFGCGYDAVSIDEARDLSARSGRPFTELKIDDIANTAHMRIRLRTLAYTSGLGAPLATADLGDISWATPASTAPDNDSAAPTPDLCSTAKALVELAALELTRDPDAEKLRVPATCLDCLNDALPFELSHLRMLQPSIEVAPSLPPLQCLDDTKPKAGLLGNPLLVFNPELNDNIAQLIEQLGWQPVYPEPQLVEIEDVRYLDQLERFRQQGVTRVIYLQSFGCLKGHVQSRGALHELSERFPNMPITIIDYDPESSALNRENRIRLALA